MLSSFLASIKEQFGTKSFWLGSMLPLVLFLGANILVLYRHCPDIATWLPKIEGLDEKTLLYSGLTAILLALAYILSAMSSVMLRAVEGKIGPRWMYGLLYADQWRAVCTIDEKSDTAFNRLETIKGKQNNWKKLLSRSLKIGENKPPLSRPEAIRWRFREPGRKMACIRWLHRLGWRIKPERLKKAVNVLGKALRQNSGKHGILSQAKRNLEAAIDYAPDRYEFEIRSLMHKRQSDFPGVGPLSEDQPEGPTANNILAPTRMGNIGRAMSTYTLMRYQLDLDLFWTRLQNSLQKDGKEYYSVLQDTKVQVDCSITLFWLSVIFTLFWTPTLLWWFPNSTVREFLTVAIGGTVMAAAFYLLACESYRVFADVMRSSVDLFRFQLLQALHIPLPFGSDEERKQWLRLGQAMFGNIEDFVYKHQP